MQNTGSRLLFVAILSLACSANATSEPIEPSASAPLLSENEFLLQKEYMIEDTANKVQVLQAAHDCAKAAETPAAFADCNKALREAILNNKPKN